jgi:cobalamin biosynthesis Co2+ chelatase CbiK
MQELMTNAGHLECYAKSDEILNRFLSADVGSVQVYRVTNHVSEQLTEEDTDDARLLPALAKDEFLYVEAGGSMTGTREDGWKEVKSARLFRSGDCLNPNTEPAWLQQSQYVAHFGDSNGFCEKWNKLRTGSSSGQMD